MAGFLSWIFGKKAPPPETERKGRADANYWSGDENWTRVDSSHIWGVAYHLDEGTAASGKGELRLRFKRSTGDKRNTQGGAIAEYYYLDVGVDVYKGLLGAASKGSYAHRYIYFSFDSKRVW